MIMDAFHTHLDECRQCREHPFDLCPKGAKLLPEAAQQSADELFKHHEFGNIPLTPARKDKS